NIQKRNKNRTKVIEREVYNKKTSKLSRTSRLCKKSHRGFSFKLHHCYLKINLLFTQKSNF
ncbi:hypothetical protein, partial [Bacteroides cellulosilyticus]|uniref:hypothetical protein n=1 Tax=Bacteroides cellulosilyticus TaxID=246787 RepID=UPI002952D111